MHKTKDGFTLVELLIVIVIIAILAAITVVAYSGIQNRAKDSATKSDIATIKQALQLYYVAKGYYPNETTYTPGSTAINSGWSTTSDGSWANLIAELQPYAQNLPKQPPGSKSTTPAISGGNNYDYYGANSSYYCGASTGQMYVLVYHLNGAQEDSTDGSCDTGYRLDYFAGASNFRMIR